MTFYNTQVPAASGGATVRRRPYTTATDLTSIQYDALGPLYGYAPDTRGPLQDVQVLRKSQSASWRSAALAMLGLRQGVDGFGLRCRSFSYRDAACMGGDLSIWRPIQREQTGPLRILLVGEDFERKGGPTLLRAFQALDAGSAQLHLVTRSRLAEMPDVFLYNNMIPNSARLIEHFQQCDVFVLPSEAEAFGIAAVEATAVGLPAIASRGCGLAEIVADGETGFLIESSDERAVAKRLHTFASETDLRLQMSRSARRRAELRFDAKRNAMRLIDRTLEISERRLPRLLRQRTNRVTLYSGLKVHIANAVRRIDAPQATSCSAAAFRSCS